MAVSMVMETMSSSAEIDWLVDRFFEHRQFAVVMIVDGLGQVLFSRLRHHHAFDVGDGAFQRFNGLVDVVLNPKKPKANIRASFAPMSIRF